MLREQDDYIDIVDMPEYQQYYNNNMFELYLTDREDSKSRIINNLYSFLPNQTPQSYMPLHSDKCLTLEKAIKISKIIKNIDFKFINKEAYYWDFFNIFCYDLSDKTVSNMIHLTRLVKMYNLSHSRTQRMIREVEIEEITISDIEEILCEFTKCNNLTYQIMDLLLEGIYYKKIYKRDIILFNNIIGKYKLSNDINEIIIKNFAYSDEETNIEIFYIICYYIKKSDINNKILIKFFNYINYYLLSNIFHSINNGSISFNESINFMINIINEHKYNIRDYDNIILQIYKEYCDSKIDNSYIIDYISTIKLYCYNEDELKLLYMKIYNAIKYGITTLEQFKRLDNLTIDYNELRLKIFNIYLSKLITLDKIIFIMENKLLNSVFSEIIDILINKNMSWINFNDVLIKIGYTIVTLPFIKCLYIKYNEKDLINIFTRTNILFGKNNQNKITCIFYNILRMKRSSVDEINSILDIVKKFDKSEHLSFLFFKNIYEYLFYNHYGII